MIENISEFDNFDSLSHIDYPCRYLKYDDNILGLIALLSNQLRLLYSISYYQSIGKTKNEIQELLNINPYRLQKAYESISNFARPFIR